MSTSVEVRLYFGGRRTDIVGLRDCPLGWSCGHPVCLTVPGGCSGHQAASRIPTRGREFGGQIKTAWRGALRRAALDPELTPHDLDDGDAPIGFVRSKKGIAGIRPSRNWRSA
jgi:hypothetical protein